MNGYLKISSPWSQLALYMGLLGGAVVLTSFISAGVLLANGVLPTNGNHFDLDNPAYVGMLKLLQAVSTVTIFLFPSIAFALICFRSRPLYYLGFRKVQYPYFIWLGLLIMILAFPFVGWLGEINQQVPLPTWMNDLEKDAGKHLDAFLKVSSPAGLLLNIFIVALLPAICEEACFRGCLQRILIHILKNPWAGIIFTAFLFSAFHLQFQGFLPRMFLGILLGGLYWYGGSLWISISAHFFANAIQVIAYYYYPKAVSDHPGIPFYTAVISAVIVTALLLVLRRQSVTRYALEYPSLSANEQDPFGR